ncbi:MAG TPA: aldehyde dehydrogenase family protein [Streptomyces sp.]|nr:aldehyde dehydrogenase family protein [Streptomyces sp.]
MGINPAPASPSPLIPPTPPTLTVKPGTAWSDARRRCRDLAPEAFADDGRVRNLWGRGWQTDGEPLPATSPVDGTDVAGPPMLDAATAREAVAASLDQHRAWRHVPLPERRARIAAALDALTEHRALLALLLVWEIGKPWKLAQADVDRAIDGVRWYADNIETMLDGRTPLHGPVSNIASWNYPMSVLVHAMLIQALAGNAVIAKTPTDGGLSCLTLACALSAREGLPLTLVSGSGRALSEPLVRAPEIGCVSFVGGRDAGARVATAVADLGKRHILEQEGLNCWGVWNYSDWEALTPLVRKTFDYAKQRCTAYPRFVVQRTLFADFLDAYLPAVRSIRYGHPLAVELPNDPSPTSGSETPYPELDFGPLINSAKAKELAAQTRDAIDRGAVPLYEGSLESGHFLEGQDTSAYLPPTTLLSPPPSSPLHHAEPFGPVDSIVLVDTEAELLAAMNASNGALVATLSTDDQDVFDRLAPQVRAFKTGHSKPRSRGDRDELFGGFGASWRGAFIGGELLIRAVTDGPSGERLPGNFPDYRLQPEADPTPAAA